MNVRNKYIMNLIFIIAIIVIALIGFLWTIIL